MHLAGFLPSHSCLACLKGAGICHLCVDTSPEGHITHRCCQALQRARTDRQTDSQTVPLADLPWPSRGSEGAFGLCGLRFRSVTKQYFRKADGILVMYDITAECSFVAVRNWMSSVQVRAGPGLQCCCSLAPTLCLEGTFFSAPGSPVDLVKLNYQSRCLCWSVWNQRLCVEDNKASGSPLNQGGLFPWLNVVGPPKTVVQVCKQPMFTGYIF